MSSVPRASYMSNTPDRATFEPSLLSAELSPERESFVPSSISTNRKSSLLFTKLQRRWSTAYGWVLRITEDNAGMLLVATAQGFLSLVNVIVKHLNGLDPPVPTLELIWARMAITWVCCVSYMLFMKIPDPILGPKGVRLLLVSRGFFGFTAISGVYYSLSYLSLSDATVLTFLAPTCTTIAAAILLDEKLSWKQLVAGLFSLFGVVLIARPVFLFGPLSHQPDEEIAGDPGGSSSTDIVTPAQRLAAVGAAMIGVLGATGAYTSIRAIGKRAHALHNLVSYSAQSVIGSTILMLVMRIPVVIPTKAEWVILLLAIGFIGFVAQFLLTAGLQRETAGRGTMAIYVQMIFAVVFERIFFHTLPTLLSVLGMIIITTSAVYVALLKEATPARKQEQNILPSNLEDISLAERLLDHQEDEENRDN